MSDPNKTAVVLASELGEQLTNGNRRLVKTTLQALPKGVGLLTVFYMARRSGTVGKLRLILDELAEDDTP